jgi:trimeric autotransporter adhesin
MATAIAYAPIDMDGTEVGSGEVTIFTSTQIQIADGTDVTNYFGTGFAVDTFGNLVGGTLTGVNNVIDGILQFEITGLNHSIVTFNDFLLVNDAQGALAFVFDGNDVLIGSSGADVVNGYGGDDSLFGGGGNDVARGGVGNDTLNGGAGNDSMYGSEGNDIYVVNSGGDFVQELPNEGMDLVRSSVNFRLPANVENLQLTSGPAVNGTGNGANNRLTGNAADNTLIGQGGHDTIDGGAGSDTMLGGTGNDVYVVNSAVDVVVENLGEGTDTVLSFANYRLSANVEHLTLTGSTNLNAIGNGSNNTLTGNSGANTLTGQGGHDILDGGPGADTLLGGNGNDQLIFDPSDPVVQGGAEIDTLRVNGSGVVLDLTLISDAVIQDMERINLTGTGNNTLTLGIADVLAISSTTNTLKVDGDAGDIVNAGEGWTDMGVVGAYHQYSQSGATLLVDTDITQNIST